MKYLSETSLLVALVVVMLACLVPVFGTGALGMMTHSLLVIIFVIFAAFFWRETPKDERDIMHQMFAGRIAFFVGIAMLLGSILWQTYMMHVVDPFLFVTIIIMIFAKVVAHAYSRTHY